MQTVRISVHVIEVRELPGKDAAGLCDPFVRVTVAGNHRKQTAIRYGQTSTAFDEQFSFPDIQLTREEYERSTIRLEVFDAKVFFRNELIGQCVFGIPSIRNLPKHEVFQEWVQLEHPQSSSGGQGYIRVSIVVYGENDRPTGHLTSNFSRTLKEIQMTAPSNQVGQVLGNPLVVEKRRGYNFQIKALRAEHLLSEGNTFLAVRFNGVLSCTPTKARSKNPDWNYQITVPVFTPRYSDIVEIELWSTSTFSETLIASTSVKFSDIMACTYFPTWFNFYGAPPEESGMAAWWREMIQKKKIEPIGYLGRALLSMSATLSDNPQSDERPCEPVEGPVTDKYVLWVDVLKGCELPLPSYGQVMVEVQFGPANNTLRTEFCTESMESLQVGTDETKTLEGKTNEVQQPKPMRIVHFTCDPLVHMANERNFVKSDRSKGVQKDDQKKNDTSKRYAQFKEIPIVLPKMEPTDGGRKTNQLWDIIVSVFVKDSFGSVTRVGYVRIKPADVWGFDNDPEWFPVRGFVDSTTGFTQSQGFLMLCCKFGPESLRDKFLESKMRVQYQEIMKTAMQPYEIRAYIYQARDLPSTDSSTGLLSSYVEMNVGGVVGKRQYTNPNRDLKADSEYRTTVARHSLNPIWYDTLIIRNIMLPQTDASTFRSDAAEHTGDSSRKKKRYVSLALAPDIELLLKAEGQSDYIGRVRFPMELASRKFWPKRARPRWIKLVKHDATTMRVDTLDPQAGISKAIPKGDFFGGELLLKLEAVPQEYANRKPWYNRHRWPKLKTMKVVVGTVGLRHLVLPGTNGGEDNSRLVLDNISQLGKLQFQVPLFPDMRSMVKSALEEYDALKMKKPGVAGTRGARIGEKAGGALRFQGEIQEDDSDEESLDSDEREDLDDDAPPPLSSRRVTIEDGDEENQIGIKADAKAEVRDKSSFIAEKVMTSEMQDFSVVDIPLQKLSAAKNAESALYRELPGEESFSFFKVATLDVNFPEDEFYAPSMTVRLLNPGSGPTFWSSAGTEDVFGSSVIPLRPFLNQGAARTNTEKPVDHTFLLPKVALSKIGKDQFEAIARRDSDYTNSTIQTPRAGGEMNWETGSQGSAGSDSTIHSLRFREASNATILPNEDEDQQQTDMNEPDVLEPPNAWPGKNEIPTTITLDTDKLNVAFDVELNSKNRSELLPVEEEHKRSKALDSGRDSNDSDDDKAEADAERENELNDTEKQRVNQENKVLRELEEFTGVFWPIGASRKQLISECVEGTLEDDVDAIRPLPFNTFFLKKGSRVVGTEEVVGRFKAVVEVIGDSGFVKREKREGSNQVMDVMQARSHAEFKSLIPNASPIARYLSGDFDRYQKEFVLKPQEFKEQTEGFLVHRLEDRGPQRVKVRVYIVQATELWSRYPDSCKPFLQLQMKVPKRSEKTFQGLTAFHDDSFNVKQGTNAFFGAMYELDGRFPDVTQLEIRAYDSSPSIGGPDFIGSTMIDLEDRWFNPKWQVMKSKKKILKEFRSLYLKNSTVPRGTLEMWVEMYDPFEAVNAKVTDIRMPKSDVWELRLVVWEARNVPPPDDQNYLSMYVTTELSYRGVDSKPRPDQYQSTDTHWWVDNGVGSFNWRQKFQLEVPCRYPRLTFKVWQTDFFTVSPDQVVGTATVDIDFLAAIAHAWESDEAYERPRMLVKLTQDRGTAQRGDLEVQISLVREKMAQSDPVGLGRDPPNKDPFLPEPKRKSFWSGFMQTYSLYRALCCLLIIAVPIAILVPVLLLK